MPGERTTISGFVPAVPPVAGARPLDPVRRFLNSRRKEEGIDSLAEVASARTWFKEQGYGAVTIGDRRLAEYRAARELIREALSGDVAAVARLDALVARARAVPSIAASGDGIAGGLRPREIPPDGRPLQAILLALWRGAASGELARLKVCADDRCQLAFYDRSRNRSRTWCTGGECGNRNRLARHRARRKAGQSAPA